VANSGSDTVSIFLGQGDSTFLAGLSYAVGYVPRSLAVADLNGDSKLDLVAADLYDNSVSILLGNGDGTFQAAASYVSGVVPLSVAVGDFNNDGIRDLAVTSD